LLFNVAFELAYGRDGTAPVLVQSTFAHLITRRRHHRHARHRARRVHLPAASARASTPPSIPAIARAWLGRDQSSAQQPHPACKISPE